VGRAATRALRPWGLDQAAGAAERAQPQHDQGGVAFACVAEVSARVGGSKLDPFKDEIHMLLRRDPGMPRALAAVGRL